MVGLKCIASRVYNQINEKNKINLNFMNNIDQKLSTVGFCNKNQKFRTLRDYNLSSFESDQPGVVNMRSIYIDVKNLFFSAIFPG